MQMFTAIFLKQREKAWHGMPVHTNVQPDSAYQWHRLPFTNMLCVTRFLRVFFPHKSATGGEKKTKKKHLTQKS